MRNTVTQPRVLARVPSKSHPTKQYEIRLGADGVVYCTCRAWITNKFCKHLEEYHSRNMTPAYPAQPNVNPNAVLKSLNLGNPNAVLKFFENQALTKVADAAKDGHGAIFNVVKFGIIGGKW